MILKETGFIKLQILVLAIAIPQFTQAQSSEKMVYPQLGISPLQDVVQAMTLQEKANLVAGIIKDAETPQIPQKVPGTVGRTYPVPRLGIPSITLANGPVGAQIRTFKINGKAKNYYSTAFPVETLLASTWDTALVRKVGSAIGKEALNYGIDVILAPGLNIQRNPLGGRNFEYFSEDPLLSGVMAAAMVNGIQSHGVGASIKHFVANNQETSRFFINEIIGQRALREIYLKGFEIALTQSDPWTVMSSFNKLNGAFVSQRRVLLTGILKEEWGFAGLVMSDWGAGDNAVEQTRAGNDLIIIHERRDAAKDIIEAVEKGALPVEMLDQNVERILKVVTKTPGFHHHQYDNHPDLKKNALLAREAATQGMVLLKNSNQTLPVKENKKVALFGFTSYDLLAGGKGSGTVNKAYSISLDQGLKNYGFELNPVLQDKYNDYLNHEQSKMVKVGNHQTFVSNHQAFEFHFGILEMSVDKTIIEAASRQDDVAIITLGRNSAEGSDRDMQSFYLSLKEKELIKNVSAAFHANGKRVIAVLNIVGPIDVAGWRDDVDAILLAWMPGQEGGNAIAEILSGKVNPSGKLAQTFPVRYGDVPSARHFPGAPPTHTQQVTYVEGIYVGYRYYHTFDVETAYPFGYGLSYTQFTYNDLRLGAQQFSDKMKVAVTVTNSGSVPGKEIVELYLSAPGKKLQKPSEELKAFAKTKLLEPGESQTLHFVLDAASLASFDPREDAWIAEAGTYTVNIGASSTDIKLRETFELEGEITVKKVSTTIIPEEEIPVFHPSYADF